MSGTKKQKSDANESTSSVISTAHIESVIESLKNKRVRPSTIDNYVNIWRSFNKFLVRLDRRPKFLEDRTALYCAFLIEKGTQSATIKSYISAIKFMLTNDNYKWNDNLVVLGSLIQACKLQNNCQRCRLPIQKSLFEQLLFEIERNFPTQVYLCVLFKSIFCLAYYGLMRINELVAGSHTIRATNIHIGKNKDKILIVLYSSKHTFTSQLPPKNKNISHKEWKRAY